MTVLKLSGQVWMYVLRDKCELKIVKFDGTKIKKPLKNHFKMKWWATEFSVLIIR